MNGYEYAARAEKTSKLIDTLIENQISSEVAKRLDCTDWSAISSLAHVNPPSVLTIDMVISRLAAIEAATARRSA